MASTTPVNASPSRPARILIVDDSAVMRALLRSVVSSDQRIEVAGTAADGESALRALDSLHPDLILLDVEMPVMDGLSTLKRIKASGKRVPVIMCSTLTQRGAKVTIEALSNGAADYVAKPYGQPSREAAVRTLTLDLVPKILALTAYATALRSFGTPHAPAPAVPGPGTPRSVWPGQVSQHSVARPAISLVTGAAHGSPSSHILPPALHPGAGTLPAVPPPGLASTSTLPPSILAIGVSTGGPAALEDLLPALPANFPLPVLIVQHMPALFTKLLAERLDGRCPLRVSEAVAGEPVRAGNIYIARGDWHMEVSTPDRNPASPVLRLTQEAPENHCRPAVDVLFRSCVQVYGSRILAVVLTGMGYDGLLGSRIIREHGGTVLAQDEPTSVVWGMPGAVAQAGLAHRVLPLNAIASEILRLTGRGQREAIELRESAV